MVRPTSVENYDQFEPPTHFRGMLDELLDCVPPEHLAGLMTIVLTNQSALTRDQRRAKTWSRNHMVRLADCQGWYQSATRTSPASIHLFVDNIAKSERPGTHRIPILRYEALGTVLYHEIGHHIHKVHRPEYRQRETVAEDWSKRLFLRFLRLHYWYLMPLVYPVAVYHRLMRFFRAPRIPVQKYKA
jgi:hypothetical protein